MVNPKDSQYEACQEELNELQKSLKERRKKD